MVRRKHQKQCSTKKTTQKTKFTLIVLTVNIYIFQTIYDSIMYVNKLVTHIVHVITLLLRCQLVCEV